jgi:hypothetical protein
MWPVLDPQYPTGCERVIEVAGPLLQCDYTVDTGGAQHFINGERRTFDDIFTIDVRDSTDKHAPGNPRRTKRNI